MSETQGGRAAGRVVPIDERLRQIEEAAEARGKPYRREGDKDWAPGADGPIETPAQRAGRRRAEYARLRAEGVRTPEAARLVGISVPTAYAYNRALKAARAAEGETAGGGR
jgi:hypothetical protein